VDLTIVLNFCLYARWLHQTCDWFACVWTGKTRSSQLRRAMVIAEGQQQSYCVISQVPRRRSVHLYLATICTTPMIRVVRFVWITPIQRPTDTTGYVRLARNFDTFVTATILNHLFPSTGVRKETIDCHWFSFALPLLVYALDICQTVWPSYRKLWRGYTWVAFFIS